MESILYGIRQINFNINSLQQSKEKRTANCVPQCAMEVSSTTDTPLHQQLPHDPDDAFSSESEDEEAAGTCDADYGGMRSTAGLTMAERRQLPPRRSKDAFLCGTKRRTIMKPSKRVGTIHKDFSDLTSAQIKKIYTNKKLKKFTPTSLETIAEESSEGPNYDGESSSRFLGCRKYRRAITFPDFAVVNKALIKKRRAKIRRAIGRRPSKKKLSLEEFIDRLNASMNNQTSKDKPVDYIDHDFGPTESNENTNLPDAADMSDITPSSAAQPLQPQCQQQ